MHPVRILASFALVAALSGGAFAAPPAGSGVPVSPRPAAVHRAKGAKDDVRPARVARPAGVSSVDNTKFVDINNIKMFVTNTGSFAYDKGTGNAGLEFPNGTGNTAVFAAGLWIGAQVGGLTRMAVSEYSDEYGPGSAAGGVPDDPNKPEYKVYKLDRVYTDLSARDAALADYNAGAVPHGAPVITVQPDGSLNTTGDQMLWAVYNDLDAANHTNRAGQTAPLGVEVQQTTFGFKRDGALGNTVFIKYRLINRGTNTLSNMYVSQWSDPDNGNASDDVVGCDPSIGLGFVYNAVDVDNVYGRTVPAVGFDFFQGPKVGGNPLAMTSFNKYINGTDPNTAAKSYNFMQGLNADGTPVINPVTGQVTKFQVDGDPVEGTGWLDANPADRRLMLSSGPFTMAPGDTQDVVTGIVIGQSSNRLASVALMKFYDTQAQAAFELDFNLASPPNTPRVVATPENNAVLLTWDNASENYNQAPYAFEGYVVYQGASIAGPYTRLATFDVKNGITVIKQNDFDEINGVIVEQVKIKGSDNGLQYTLHQTQSSDGSPIHNGTTYYYWVTAYSAALGSVPKVLESPRNLNTATVAVPQTPAGGVDLSTAGVATGPTQGQYSTAVPPGTDDVTVTVVDPNQTIAASYRVGYKPDATGTIGWYVVRTVGAVVDTVINNQSNFTGDNSYPIVDGVQVKIVGKPLGELGKVSYVPVGNNLPGLRGNPDIGGAFFNGSADYTSILVASGSALDPADLSWQRNVEIRFTGGPAGQKAYRYLRCNCSPRNYNYQDFVDVPFTVWDVDGNRQLDAGFLENFAAANGIWDPDSIPDPFDSSVEDDRQWISIYDSDYQTTPRPEYQIDWAADGATLNMMYSLWADGTSSPRLAGDRVTFALSKRSVNDYYDFTTVAANRFEASLAKSELDRVNVVPNPYFLHSSYELNQFERVVKFTHLPAQCTVRIYNLAGDLVRTLQKGDTSSMLTWDLETSNGLPVASGIYVFHVDAPNVGSKVGKVAIFMEKERLNNF